MKISDVLDKPYTAEELLAHQRKLHEKNFTEIMRDVRRHANDAAFVEGRVRATENPMKNLFILPGTGGKLFDVGTPPAWNECRTTDEEYLWSLNRMNYYNILSEAYLLTGDRRYADKVTSDTENWIDTCPMPPFTLPLSPEDRKPYCGLHPWRTLEVGIRVFDSWKTAYERLLLTDAMTPDFHAKLAVSFWEHGYVLRNISPVLWPRADHNHYLHEMLGLLCVVCLFPDFKDADEWRSFAVRELGRCAQNQFTPEGGQVEGCPGYHGGCLSMLYTALELGRTYGVEFPSSFRKLCILASDYAAFATCPDGNWAAIGDSPIMKGARGTVIKTYRCFGKLGRTERLLPLVGGFSPEEVPEAVQKAGRAHALTIGGEDCYQRSLDQYFARTGWSPDDSYFAFVCHTPVNNGHAHQDPMSFVLYLHGKAVVIDPSYFTYQSGDDRKLFKSPEYHSCLTFDNKPPFEYLSQWGYSAQKDGHIAATYHLPDVFAADASHENYEPDEHRRLCALVGKDTFLVIDDVKNVRGTDVRLWFHMDDAGTKLADGGAVADGVRVLAPEGLAAERLDGRKSPHTDVDVPSSRLCFTDVSHAKDALYVTVFTASPDVKTVRAQRTADGVEFVLNTKTGKRGFLWNLGNFLSEIQ